MITKQIYWKESIYYEYNIDYIPLPETHKNLYGTGFTDLE